MIAQSDDGLVEITLEVNGERRTGFVEPRLLLADFLRHDLKLTGTHIGCEQGVCGACTVHLDGHSVRSCITFAVQTDGRSITTVEGLAGNGPLTELQQSFHQCHALQCGYCTPGMLMTLAELLRDIAAPTDVNIDEALSGNLCRCTGYINIKAAVRRVVDKRLTAGTSHQPFGCTSRSVS